MYNSIMTTYDPRYLAGVLFFNRRDFFEAHEVWEDLWGESHDIERRFVQGLIQAAVALYHFGNGNFGGTVKLYRSGRAYMEQAGSPFWGLDIAGFWRAMEECCRPVLGTQPPERTIRPDPALIPTIVLDPPPEAWPDPEEFIEEE